MWNRNTTPKEIKTEKENIIVFDIYKGNPVMNMIKNFSENHEGDERIYIDNDGDEIVLSYRILSKAHNVSGFDRCIFLISLVKENNRFKNYENW